MAPTLTPASASSTRPRWDPFDDIDHLIRDVLYDDLVEAVQRQGYPTGMTEVDDFIVSNIDRAAGEASFSAGFSAEHPAGGSLGGTLSGRFEFFLDEAQDLLDEGEIDEEEARDMFLETVKLVEVEALFALD